MRVLDLFSCIGNHPAGLHAAGPFQTIQFVEIDPWRRSVLARHFPEVPQHDDVRTFTAGLGSADVVVGGPPCQQTSVASAIHGKRTGSSLWCEMRRICNDVQPEWIVVEQPPGNAAWEALVSGDLADIGYHSARLEFAASDLGAPHPRRRVFILANRDLPRLQVAWAAGPSAIGSVKRSAAARGAWRQDLAGDLRVDAGDAGGLDRQRRIEAIGDSNPPAMMEVIGRAILAARP